MLLSCRNDQHQILHPKDHELVSVDTVSLFIEKSFIIICSSDLVSSLFSLQFLPMGASE